MPELHYRDAQKTGQREYRSRVASGQYPYLPVLDEIVPPERAVSGQDMGVISVPADFIVGTKTRGRTNAFAANFMPLLADNTEFSQKWERLCQSHLKEGIRDPIKAYEFLNRYYVEEGNKRVSVLKFFGAVNIPAQVIRIMPEMTGAPETERYLEYLAFNKVSGINYLELTKKGDYTKLLTLMGMEENQVWTDEDRSRFSSAYHAFKSAFDSMGSVKADVNTGDAMLAFVKIYGYDCLLSDTASELKKAVARAWEELRLQKEASPIEIKPEPAGEKKESLLSKVLPISRPTRVAFIYDRNPSNSAWAWAHEQGRQQMLEALGGRIETRAYTNAMDGDPLQIIESAIEEDSKVIFTTSPRLLPASLKAAVEHSEVTILNCSLNQSHRYIRTYFVRSYEAKFIVGAIAGAMADGSCIGYICDYPIYGVIASINAFALGVQLTNPQAKVILEWSSVDGHRAVRRKLENQGVRLISCQDFSRKPDGSFGLNGLMRMDEAGPVMLAAPVWKWDVYYTELMRRILNKTAKDEYSSSAKALNYYWGMSAGVVDIACSPELPEGVQKLAKLLKQAICQETCQPFELPVRDQSGICVADAEDSLSLEQIVSMDYLVENVVGAIPAYEDLNRGKETVKVMGVETIDKPAKETNAQ